jgi:hypothetical protein
VPRASAQAENRALAGIFAAAAPVASATSHWTSLHTADPGTTGASEYAGVTRQQYPAGTPSAGSISNTAIMTFTTSGATPVTHVGKWDAATGGNYEIGAQLASPVTAATITFAVGADANSAS